MLSCAAFQFFAELGHASFFAGLLQLFLTFAARQYDLALPGGGIVAHSTIASPRWTEGHAVNRMRHDRLDARPRLAGTPEPG